MGESSRTDSARQGYGPMRCCAKSLRPAFVLSLCFDQGARQSHSTITICVVGARRSIFCEIPQTTMVQKALLKIE